MTHHDDVLLGVHQRPLDGGGHLPAGLAADAHQALAVADDGRAAEAHELPSLDHLGHARQLDDALLPVLLLLAGALLLAEGLVLGGRGARAGAAAGR